MKKGQKRKKRKLKIIFFEKLKEEKAKMDKALSDETKQRNLGLKILRNELQNSKEQEREREHKINLEKEKQKEKKVQKLKKKEERDRQEQIIQDITKAIRNHIINLEKRVQIKQAEIEQIEKASSFLGTLRDNEIEKLKKRKRIT